MTPLSAKLVEQLQRIVGADHLLRDADQLLLYGRDQTRVHQACPCAVALPDTVEQVLALVRLANQAQLAIVPSGGRTGLSGGAVAAAGELVIAMDRINQIDGFNRTDRTVRCGAGVISAPLQQYVQAHGRF